LKLTEDNIRITKEDAYFSGNEVIITTNKQKQVKQQILQNQKLRELVEKHHNSCPERWCHCKSVEFDDILEEMEK